MKQAIASLLAEMRRRLPHIWRAADAARAVAGRTVPREVFLADTEARAILAGCAAEGGDIWPDDLQALLCLAAWRSTQDIYTVDEAVLAALATTPVDTLPTAALRLPAWCVYIDTPTLEINGLPDLHGFFAHLAQRMDGQPEVRFVPLMGDMAKRQLVPFSLELHQEKPLEVAWLDSLDAAMSASGQRVDRKAIAKIPQMEAMKGALAALLSITLYVCAEGGGYQPDIWAMPRGAAPYPVRAAAKGWRLYPPKSPRVVHLGAVIGEQIRAAQEAGAPRAAGSHASPRPHVRRAHWHGYWHGPKKGQDGAAIPQKYKLTWLPPIAVAMGEGGEDE